MMVVVPKKLGDVSGATFTIQFVEHGWRQDVGSRPRTWQHARY